MRRWRAPGVACAAAAVLASVPALAGGATPAPTGPPPITGVSTALARFAGIPSEGMVLGRPGAPVRVTEYADLGCPHCAHASPGVVRRIVRRYIRPGRASFRLRVVGFVAPWSPSAAIATHAAAAQGMAWPFATAVLANQGPETADPSDMAPVLEEIARRLGLDVERWRADLEAAGPADAFARDERRAGADGILGVPTFVLSGPRGRRMLIGDVGIRRFAAAYAAVAPRPRPTPRAGP
ncbi:MAG TPA: thioredoxin domain-containing protein [Miltoncostaea sp.]|nr:thioredoxin domain-containing protein [Miltoncostaea sp.]